jgi:hypothetical protein
MAKFVWTAELAARMAQRADASWIPFARSLEAPWRHAFRVVAIHNGGRPFLVLLAHRHARVYGYRPDGSRVLHVELRVHRAWTARGTVLLEHTSKGKRCATWIGDEIRTFHLRRAERVRSFRSTLGPNEVLYPYFRTSMGATLLLVGNRRLPTSHVPGRDVYRTFYSLPARVQKEWSRAATYKTRLIAEAVDPA